MKEELIIVYQKETDGEIVVEKRSIDEVKKIVKTLDSGDYALIGGEVIKDFKDKSIVGDLFENAKEMVKNNIDAKN